MKRIRMSIVFVWLGLQGCSNFDLYNMAQDYEKKRCKDFAREQLEECMTRASETYEEYTRKRKQVLESTSEE